VGQKLSPLLLGLLQEGVFELVWVQVGSERRLRCAVGLELQHLQVLAPGRKIKRIRTSILHTVKRLLKRNRARRGRQRELTLLT
jgi:hypothetical protein